MMNIIRLQYFLTAVLCVGLLPACTELDEGDSSSVPDEVSFKADVTNKTGLSDSGLKSASGRTTLHFVTEDGSDTITVHTSAGYDWPEYQWGEEYAATKGGRITQSDAISGIGVYIYDGSASQVSNAQFTFGEHYWTASPTLYWPGTGSLDFQAYAPYGCGATMTSKGQLSYTVPSTMSEQTDLLVAAQSNVDGAGASVPTLTFSHALTAVRFVAGSNMSPGLLKSISFIGVYGAGTYDFSSGTWTPSGSKKTFTEELNLTVYDKTTLYHDRTYEITPADEYFFMMPQTFESGAKMRIVFNDGVGDVTLEADLSASGASWGKGEIVTYKLSTSSVVTEFSITATRNGTDSSSGTKMQQWDLKVTANRNGSDMAWELNPVHYPCYEYAGVLGWDDDVNSFHVNPSWRDYVFLPVSTYDYTYGLSPTVHVTRSKIDAPRLSSTAGLTTAGLIPSATSGYLTPTSIGQVSYPYQELGDLFVNEDLADYHFANLGNTSQTPLDLSRAQFDSSQEGGGYPVYSPTATDHSTANCYLINAAGWYCFPVVPGNAIMDGLYNVTEGNGLDPMKSYLDTETSQGIFTNASSVEVLWKQSTKVNAQGYTSSQQPWTDVLFRYELYPYYEYTYFENGATIPSFYTTIPHALEYETVYGSKTVRSLTPSNDLVTVSSLQLMDGNIGRSGSPCKYVLFYIAPQMEDNVLIAVRNSSGDIVWSWHIWVVMSDDSPLYLNNTRGYRKPVTGPVLHSNYEGCTGNTYRLLNRRLGELAVTYRYLKSPLVVRYSIRTPNDVRHVSCEFPIKGVDILYSSQVLQYSFGQPEPFLATELTPLQYVLLNSRQARYNMSYEIYDYTYEPFDITVDETSVAIPGGGGGSSIVDSNTVWSGCNYTGEAYAAATTYKTIYDPCPRGYKVPVADVFRAFSSDGQVILYSDYKPEQVRNDVNFQGYDFLYEDTDRNGTDAHPTALPEMHYRKTSAKLSDVRAIYYLHDNANNIYRLDPLEFTDGTTEDRVEMQARFSTGYWSSLPGYSGLKWSVKYYDSAYHRDFYPLKDDTNVGQRIVPMAE